MHIFGFMEHGQTVRFSCPHGKRGNEVKPYLKQKGEFYIIPHYTKDLDNWWNYGFVLKQFKSEIKKRGIKITAEQARKFFYGNTDEAKKLFT